MSPTPVLEVTDLVKTFDSRRVVDQVSFSVPAGSVVGLLGPNGAGKTTTINMLLGLTSYDSGRVTYFGKDLLKHRGECLQRINFTSSYNSLQSRITVGENLRVFALLYGIAQPAKKLAELFEYFEVEDLVDREYWGLSAGQQTRINLIKAMLNEPELLLMDEPTASLDPDIADRTLSLIEQLRRDRNTSILYTSHNMAEVERICDSVVFLQKGRVVAHDTPEELTARIPTAELRLVFPADNHDRLEKWLQENNHDHSFTSERAVLIRSDEKSVPILLFAISNIGIDITDIEIRKPTLEDVFLEIARAR